MSFMSKDYGYVSALSPAAGTLRDTFSANSNAGFFTSLGMDQQPPPRQLDVTDFAGKKFHVEMPSNLPVTSVQGPSVDSRVDFDGMRAGVANVRQDYMNTDAMIKNVVVEAARQVMGKEAGDHLMGQLLPKGSPTHLQAAATMIPTGSTIALYSVLNTLNDERKATPRGEMLVQMEKVLSCIQDDSHKQAHGGIDEGQSQQSPLKIPPELDFSGVTPEEMMAFIERPVEKDRVMRETEQALDAIDHFKKHQDYAEEHDAEFLTAGKVEDAMRSDNTERLAELVGGAQEAEIVKTEYTALAVVSSGANLNALPKITFERNNQEQLQIAQDIQKALEERGAASAPVFDREAELQQVANYNSRPGMAA